MFRPLSRSRAFRSKRHAAGTSPAHKWRSFQNFTFYWCRKELENFEFFQNSTFDLWIKLCSERGGQVSLILQMQFGLLSAANSENWFYRYSPVFCSLQVWLGGREISLKDLMPLPPTRVLTKVKTRIKYCYINIRFKITLVDTSLAML